MNDVSKTLYIPLYGKALVSGKGIILKDTCAEEIWERASFPLKRKSRSKWLAYYMAMRASTMDMWLKKKIQSNKDAVILHLGCGLDSRFTRVGGGGSLWFDIDFEDVISERRKYFTESEGYRMLSSDIRTCDFISSLPKSTVAIVIMEGVSMYLKDSELKKLFADLSAHFPRLLVLLDCYTPLGVKMSKIKNPAKDVGATAFYGIENPHNLENGTGLKFVKEHSITPKELTCQLRGIEGFIFRLFYAGELSKKLYKLYEYEN